MIIIEFTNMALYDRAVATLLRFGAVVEAREDRFLIVTNAQYETLTTVGALPMAEKGRTTHRLVNQISPKTS